MRFWLFALTALLALNVPALAQESSPIDWEAWQHLAVQDGGRQKPLDTVAGEAVRLLRNRASFTDPETGEKLSPIALYLSMLLEWDGWDQGAERNPHGSMDYFHGRKPDPWDQAPLLGVDYRPLQEALKFAAGEKYISVWSLRSATIEEPTTGRETSFVSWAGNLADRKVQTLSPLERKALELADAFYLYQALRMGTRLELIPIQGSQHSEWVTLANLVRTKWDQTSDPTGLMRKAQSQFLQARAALLARSYDAFNESSAAFLGTLQEAGPQWGAYPSPQVLALEVGYNRWAPFRIAGGLTTLAFVLLLLGMGSRWRFFYVGGVVAFTAGLAAMLAGFALRIAISGRAPVTNMYESVVYVGLGTAVFGLIFELIYRRQYILSAAAAITTVVLILADNCSAVLDPSLRPLTPVLRNNFWLVIHVMSITLSYAAFALALGIGNITLGHYLFRSQRAEAIAALSRFTYRVLQVGVLLLAAGTILGGVWADYAWGRFWGWDPKEVWALISLLGYLALLHARYIGWVRDLGLAAWSVICFALVVMAWYGVNYVLGAGLHTYGFGGGGQEYVYAVLAVQFVYVAAAVWRAAGLPKKRV